MPNTVWQVTFVVYVLMFLSNKRFCGDIFVVTVFCKVCASINGCSLSIRGQTFCIRATKNEIYEKSPPPPYYGITYCFFYFRKKKSLSTNI